MKKIPFKQIMFGCLAMALLVAARSAVTVGKAFYYRTDWVAKLVEDPWFIVGLVAAAVGLLALLLMMWQRKERPDQPAQEDAPSESE